MSEILCRAITIRFFFEAIYILHNFQQKKKVIIFVFLKKCVIERHGSPIHSAIPSFIYIPFSLTIITKYIHVTQVICFSHVFRFFCFFMFTLIFRFYSIMYTFKYMLQIRTVWPLFPISTYTLLFRVIFCYFVSLLMLISLPIPFHSFSCKFTSSVTHTL